MKVTYSNMDDQTQLGAPASTHADYDLLPYPAMPIAYTQPAHLAALGTLFGLHPAAADGARVLELGGAAGGNIIPLAARFPGASFLGVDLSQRHIADGQDRIAALGLHNVRLRQADLTSVDLGEERFDYIICHGVFSWVPPAARAAIFRLCNRFLAPGGMAAISYNVLPGWHLRTAIRDLCVRYAGNDGSPQKRVAGARAALQRIAVASDPMEPYGLLMQTEARRLQGVPSAYILGEFLAPDNAPCYVQDFIAQASAHRLDYLCEADLFAAVPHTMDAAIRRGLNAAGAERSAAEQDIDFLTGRLFRRSVLVRSRPAGASPPMPHPDRLRSLHVSCPLRLAPASSAGNTVLLDEKARSVTIADPAISRAISRLADAFPGTLRLDELTDDGDPTTQLAERVRDAVLTMVMAGRAVVSAVPLRVGRADQIRPAAWPLARAEAATGQAWITSLRHTGVPALPVIRALLPWLDGTRDRAALRAALTDALRSGAVPIPDPPADRAGPSPACLAGALDACAGQYLEQTLSYLSRQGLFVPAHDETSQPSKRA